MIVAMFVVSLSGVKEIADAKSLFSFSGNTIYGFSTAPTEKGVLVIPETIDGMAVKSIENNGSAMSFSNEEVVDFITGLDLTQATQLTKIGKDTFTGCSGISGTLVLPNSITSIARNSFYGTGITKVVVPHTDTALSLRNTSFNAGTTLVFKSKTLMDDYASNLDLTNYNLTYMYTQMVELNDTQIPTIEVEYGEKLGDNYTQLQTQLGDVLLYKGEELVTAETTMDGTIITAISQVACSQTTVVKKSVEHISVEYGDECKIYPNIVGTYEWKCGETVVSTDSYLSLELNAGTYEYVCEIKNDDDVEEIIYVINVSPKGVSFTWPTTSVYEYYDLQEIIDLMKHSQANMTLYKWDNGYVQSSEMSTGQFRLIATPKSNNFVYTNDTFDFAIENSKVKLVWDKSEFNYTSEFFSPSYQVVSECDIPNLEICFRGDSEVFAKNVGKYTIYVVGLTVPYCEFTSDSQLTFNWEIVPTTLSVVWSENRFVYNTLSQSPSANGVNDDISIPLNIQKISNARVKDNLFIDVGTYTISASVPAQYTGFRLNGDTTNTCTILASEIQVEFDCADTYTYSGQYVTITAKITTPDVEDCELILENHCFKDAGKYTAKVVGTTNDNYVVAENSFKWEIQPKSISVKWGSRNFTYNGNVQKPTASADTGIDGETVSLTVETDRNISASDDGYTATATLSNPNYELTNDTVTYFIRRAQAYLEMESDVSVVYNGKNQLPRYTYTGENLVIIINGIESNNGVKDVGTYEIFFTSPESTNYLAFSGEYICWFTIKPDSLTATVSDASISVINKDLGFDISNLAVSEVEEYDKEVLTDEILQDYTLSKVVALGNDQNISNANISISIQDVKPSRIRVYVLTENGLVEKQLSVSDDSVVFVGDSATYYILVQNLPWIQTTLGILTITLSCLVVLGVIVAFFVTRHYSSFEQVVKRRVEALLVEKLSEGETITPELTQTLREQVISDLTNEQKNNKK